MKESGIIQGKQGQWMWWEEMEKRKLSLKELWGIEAHWTSFITWTVYGVLSSPSNLYQWYGEDPTCPLCRYQDSLKHILLGCRTSVARCTVRHNQAASLEAKSTVIDALPLPPSKPTPRVAFISSCSASNGVNGPKPHPGLLGGARDKVTGGPEPVSGLPWQDHNNKL